jgi:HemK-like putative methylase
MPRLAPALLHHARRRNPLLPILLRECRDTRSAQNELRWLTEHAIALQSSPRYHQERHRPRALSSAPGWKTILRKLVRRRARGEPLQYILGTQPFGDLEILCERGALIPRSETEAYTVRLAELVEDLRQETATKRQKLRILDLCTGTGCISLLLHSLLKPPDFSQVVANDALNDLSFNAGLEILGMDISNAALRLAKKNLHHNLEQRTLHSSAKHDISFVRANVLSKANGKPAVLRHSPQDPGNDFPNARLAAVVPSARELLRHEALGKQWDILISNPPYISPRNFSPGGTTTRSVRRWEPQLALLPRQLQFSPSQSTKPPEYGNQLEPGDEFYPPLLKLARSVDAKAIVLEVGDNGQAVRVKQMAVHCFSGESEVTVEIWRDDGTVETANSDRVCRVRGSESRAVVIWRSSWAKWRMRGMGACNQRS